MEKIYIGNAKTLNITKNGNTFQVIKGSICLDDIPQIEPHENGKRYVNFFVQKRRQKDNFGNDFSIVFLPPRKQEETKKQGGWAGSTMNVPTDIQKEVENIDYPKEESNPEDIPF